MSDPSIRLFVKPYCGWCTQVMDWLDAHGLQYEVRDVLEDSRDYAEMVRISGQSLAPVIEVNGRVLADFGVKELAAWWQQPDRVA